MYVVRNKRVTMISKTILKEMEKVRRWRRAFRIEEDGRSTPVRGREAAASQNELCRTRFVSEASSS
jgi:hypothetical protein